MTNNSKVLKNTFIYTGLVFFQKAVAFLMLPVYTIFFSPEEYGIGNLLISIANFFILFFTFGLDETSAKFYFDAEKDQRSNIIGIISKLSLIISIFSFILLLCLKKVIFFNLVPSVNDKLVFVTIVSICSSPIYNIYQKILRISEKAKEFVTLSLFYSFSQIILTITFVLVFSQGIFGYLLSISIVNFVFFIYSIIKLLKTSPSTFDKTIVINIFCYAQKIYPHLLASWGLISLTLVFIGKILGEAQVGLFTGLSYGGIILLTLSIALINSWQPWLYRQLKEKKENSNYNIKLVYKSIFVIFLSISLFLSLFSSEITHLIINKRYFEGIQNIPFIIFFYFNLCISSFCAYFLYFHQQITKHLSISTIIGVAVNTILSYILITFFGLKGACLSLAIAFLFVSIYRQYIISNYSRYNFYTFDLFFLSFVSLVICYYANYYELGLIYKLLIFVVSLLMILFIYRVQFKFLSKIILGKKNA